MLGGYLDMDAAVQTITRPDPRPCLPLSFPAVACGNEIKSVVNAVERFNRWPMGKIDQTHMWQVGCYCCLQGGLQVADGSAGAAFLRWPVAGGTRPTYGKTALLSTTLMQAASP